MGNCKCDKCKRKHKHKNIDKYNNKDKGILLDTIIDFEGHDAVETYEIMVEKFNRNKKIFLLRKNSTSKFIDKNKAVLIYYDKNNKVKTIEVY